MKQYLPWILAGTILVGAGASSANLADRDLIIRLQGEVTVLQKQIRDLQESFDKAQGQQTAIFQRMADNSENSYKLMATIEDQFKTSQTAQTNNLSGTTARLAQLADKMGSSDQRFNQISQQINALRESIEAQTRKMDDDRAREQRERQDRETREKQAEAAPPAVNSPDQLYAVAYQQFSQGKYEIALGNFRRYIDGYAQTEAADNAMFWIGESLVALGRQAEALVQYERLINDYPKGDKTPTAMLRRGVLLLQQERRDEGVSSLRNVIAYFPNTTEAAQASQELLRLGESPTAPAARPAGPTRPRTGRP